MLEITSLRREDLPLARRLVEQNHLETQERISVLPTGAAIPELHDFVEGGIAYGAWQDRELVGFLGFYAPFEGLFGPVLGTFSPLHGHAAVVQNRARIYSRLYEAAAAELVNLGATSHAVVLYAGDKAAMGSFFTNGFGLRTVDAVRRVERLTPSSKGDLGDVTFCELRPSESASLLPLHHGMIHHLNSSPTLMPSPALGLQELMDRFVSRDSRNFVAMDDGRAIAYIEIVVEGENFTMNMPTMRNITSAFIYPDYRGRGIVSALLDYSLTALETEGFTHLGVDFEGFNPTARGFWPKHFTPITNGMTRRIDERILIRNP